MTDVSTVLPSLLGIEDALARVRRYLPETPLVRSEALSSALDAEVWLKNETVSPIASFKLRGALTALLRAGERQELTGVVTSSTGNHGQGVAYAARALGIAAYVFLPEKPNPVKRAMIASLGATIYEQGHDLDAAKEAAIAYASRHGYAFVDDGESLDVIEGAATVGLEVARGLDAVDALFVGMGSGSLASGVGAALKAIHPKARVVAVQSEGSPAMTKSFHAKQAVTMAAATVADGLMSRVPARLALAALRAFVDDAMTVSDDDLLAGVHALAVAGHVLVEPSGAAGVVGAFHRAHELRGSRVVVVLTGSNITRELFVRAAASTALF